MKARKSWAMAYCGMAAALSVALMLLGAVVPVLMLSRFVVLNTYTVLLIQLSLTRLKQEHIWQQLLLQEAE